MPYRSPVCPVDGRGLLLGAGNTVGTTNNARIFATLICGATEHSTNSTPVTGGVLLEPDGDFCINDELTPTPPAEAKFLPVAERNAHADRGLLVVVVDQGLAIAGAHLHVEPRGAERGQ